MVPGVYGRDLTKSLRCCLSSDGWTHFGAEQGLCISRFFSDFLQSLPSGPRVCYKPDLGLEEKMEARDECLFYLFLLFTHKCNKKASFLLLIALCYRVLNSDKPFEWTKENRNWLGMIGISPLVSFCSIHWLALGGGCVFLALYYFTVSQALT